MDNLIDVLCNILDEKRKHYSGPLSASDWISILRELESEYIVYIPVHKIGGEEK